LSPPFENFVQERVALAKLFQIVAGINGIGQHGNNIRDDEPPLLVTDGAADFLSLEQSDAGFGVLAGFTHGHSLYSVLGAHRRRRMLLDKARIRNDRWRLSFRTGLW
jgi:hypothetical protein